MLHSTTTMRSPASPHRVSTGWLITSLALALISIQNARAGEDLIVDDFESGNFDSWTIVGQAFGATPASGTLPNQMPVDGFLGNGYASSFHGGDGSIGAMQSKAFVIERPYLNFLIGGGAYPDQTCIRLRIDGRSVLEAVGPNRNSGGSERLTWNGWDVRAWIGKTATLEIIDDHVGGWGHISVDHIVQSDVFRGPKDITREIPITQAYVMLPVDAAAPLVALQAFDGDTRTHQLDITLGNAKSDFLAPVDVRAWIGKTLRWTFRTNEGDEAASRLEAIHFPTSDSPNLPATDVRPTFHFTAQTGWLNDPNGLVHHNGLWHLYFQHNPVGWNWGNMHWGHATSPDLLQWTEHDDVFRPWVQLRGAAFSGSAVVDVANTSGWGRDGKPPIVAALTDTDAGESMAYSLDGFDWTLYDGNPVVKHPGRDPRILWHQPTQRWVMAVYDETDAKQNIAFHTSADLKHWQFESRIDGFFECPDLIELPLPNQPGASRWVLYGADGQYLTGQFDGRVFTPDTGPKQRLWWGNFYAAQTFSNAPDGRCIQIGWGQGIEFPGQRFNQQMTLPVELSLRDGGPRGLHMVAEPVRELHLASRPIPDIPTRFSLQPNTPQAIELPASSVDVSWTLETENPMSVVTLEVRGVELKFDLNAQQVTLGDTKIPLRGPRQRIPMRLLIDRGSLELFLHDGDAVLSSRLRPSTEPATLQFVSSSETTLENVSARSVNTTAPTKAILP
jgi:fructan beta-fructosidase